MENFIRKPMVRRMALTTLALALGASAGTSLASNSPYGKTVFFGDSLTDSGYLEGLLGFQRSLTTNPDPVWAEHLAAALGGNADAAWNISTFAVVRKNGDNFAAGGARSLNQGNYPSSFVASFIPTVSKQVDTHLQDQARLRADGLYSVWTGANDILASLASQSSQLGSASTRDAAVKHVLADASRDATHAANLATTLQKAGAGTVMVLNIPNIGRTPFAAQTGAQTLLSMATLQFNDTLNQRLLGYKGELVMLDVRRMLDEVIDHPMRFGLTNVSTPACNSKDFLTGGISASTCTGKTLVEAAANKRYLFADGLHPTGAGHQLLNDYALSVLQAPTRIGLLPEAPLAGNRVTLRSLEERLRLRAKDDTVQVYANMESGTDDRNSSSNWAPGLDNRLNILTVGADRGIGQHWVLGANVAYAQHRASLGQDSGSFRMAQTQASAYAQYRMGGWASALVGSAGYLDYRDISRDFNIGPARLREQGNTKGNNTALAALTRYDWGLGPVTLSPSARISWQRVLVDGYNEERGGHSGTSLHYAEQTRFSLVSNVGLTMSAVLAAGQALYQPFVNVAWETEHRNQNRRVYANVRNMAGRFSQTIQAPSSNALLLSTGVSATFAQSWKAALAYHGRYSSGQRAQSVQATLTRSF